MEVGKRVRNSVSLRNGLYRAGECLSYLGGLALSLFFLSQLALGEVERRDGIAAFQATQAAQAGQTAQVAAGESPAAQPSRSSLPSLPLEGLAPPDTSDWAPGRVADYRASLEAELPSVLGVLRAPAIDLEVPVYATDNELTMDRGAGIIDGMAYPHEGGNIGIAGHRDGYFRALKDIDVGDELVLQTLRGAKRFTVDSTRVVEIEDTHVLAETDQQTLTLVTCYPFYFVGHAPQRFVVTARLDSHYVNRN